jgi:Putative Ig domain
MRARTLLFALGLVAALGVVADAPGGGISDETCPNVAGENTNTCPPGTLGAPYAIRFVEREGSGCGPGRQTFHLDSGILPPGLTLELDGRLSGTPNQPGRFQFYVQMREPDNDPEHCAGKRTEKQFTLRVRPQPFLVPASTLPPPSEVGVPFRMKLRARGGTGVFAWRLVGGRLPAGLRLHDDGSLGGTPRRAGTDKLEVRARDTEARTVTWPGTLVVAPRLFIRTRRLTTAVVGRAYSATLRADGGVAPRAWRLTRGPLPRGLHLVPAVGGLVGVPRTAGTYRVTFEVRDGLEVKSSRTIIVVVAPERRMSHEARAFD